MTEGEPRYLGPNELFSAIRTNPPKLFQGATTEIADLRNLSRAEVPNLFTYRSMLTHYLQVTHGTVGAIITPESGIISHLGDHYYFNQITTEQRKDDSEKEKELLAEKVDYRLIRENDSWRYNAMFRLSHKIGIYDIPVADHQVGIEIIRYKAAGSVTMDFYKIVKEQEEEREVIITAGHPGDVDFQREIRDSFRGRYLS